MEGTPRRLDGQYRPVEVYMHDYRQVNGVLIPFVLETRVRSDETVPGRKQTQTITERITIDNVVVNPKLDDSLFSRPKSEVAASDPHKIDPTGSALRR